MEGLSVGFSLLILKGIVSITVFSVDIWGQLFEGMIQILKKKII